MRQFDNLQQRNVKFVCSYTSSYNYNTFLAKIFTFFIYFRQPSFCVFILLFLEMNPFYSDTRTVILCSNKKKLGDNKVEKGKI